VVPKPRTVTAPIALGLPRDAPLLYDFVETWLTLQRESGVLDQLQDYWILGQGAESTEPRWSVIRNVLGWVDWWAPCGPVHKPHRQRCTYLN